MARRKVSEGEPWPEQLEQPRVAESQENYLRPQRWNWYALIRPLDRTLAHQAQQPLPAGFVRNLRFFWLDGLFASISDTFYLSFITLYALAFGASNSQVGAITAVANLLGALSFFPGARLVERVRWRKPLVVWSGGTAARLMLLALALIPFVTGRPELAIALIVVLNGVRAFTANLANPAWTSLVASIVPSFMRGRYLGSRNTAMGLAAMLVVPLAGWLIDRVNRGSGSAVLGYQATFALAFLAGMLATLAFQRIREPGPSGAPPAPEAAGARIALAASAPGFLGFVGAMLVFNLALQVAAPFFNVYLVRELGASTATVGLLTSVSSLMSLVGYQVFSRLVDRKGPLWVLVVSGFIIPVLPLLWILVRQPYQVAFINTLGGFIWAGFNLANFALLLTLTPEAGRPRLVALYQTAVFSSAVIGPILGGFLADAASFQVIFAVSGIGRLIGMGLLVVLTVRPLRELASAAGSP
jgi:MFS family permease